MDDIVERLLRYRIDKGGVRRAPEKVKREAAAEIERLRAEIAERDAEIAAWLREWRPELADAIEAGAYRKEGGE